MTGTSRLARFWSVGALGLVVQLATLAGLADALAVPQPVAVTAAVAVAVVHNFIWHRRWTWADREDATTAPVTFARFVAANGIVSLVGNVAITMVLSGWLDWPAVVANIVAVAACGIVNFMAGDVFVFAPSEVEG